MRIIDCKKIDTPKHEHITFIRVEPLDLELTVEKMICNLNDLSWISEFEEDFMQDGFKARAEPTIKDITQKLLKAKVDKISGEAGEYIVSELSRKAIIEELKYLNIPLSELFSKQSSGNPGFDFHTENNSNIILFGEAKYVSRQNAYGRGLSQVVKFIKEKKDLKDLIDLKNFCSSKSLSNANKGKKGFAIGFSSKTTPTDKLIQGIIKNKDYKSLTSNKEIIMVAVNI